MGKFNDEGLELDCLFSCQFSLEVAGIQVDTGSKASQTRGHTAYGHSYSTFLCATE